MDAVVNRHDGRAAGERREHVVRRVEDVDLAAPEFERQADLLAHGVVGRAIGDGREVRSQADVHGIDIFRRQMQHA